MEGSIPSRKDSTKKALQYNMDIGDVREEYLCVDKQTIAVRNYYTMQQYWYGIPMLGYSLIMDVDGSGQVKSISGTYCDLDDFEPSVALNESDAGVAAEYYLDYTGGLKEEDYELRSEGLVIAMLDSEPKTVYQFYLIDAFTDEPYRNLLVDGNTGEVVVDNDWIFAETISDVLNKSGIS